ncbi:hypothetical protein NBRC10513v2_005036 [Rhodotorula toruloides]
MRRARALLYAYIAATPHLPAYDPTSFTPILVSATSFLASPPSPPSYRPSFLERRRQRLAFFLATILLHPILGGDPIVRQWVLE